MGFAPTKEESFWIGAETKPDYYCCDSGSDDIGPGPLGTDTCVSPYEWQKHDLELMLVASRKQGVPMMIGSSGDTGTNSRVDMYIEMISTRIMGRSCRACLAAEFVRDWIFS